MTSTPLVWITLLMGALIALFVYVVIRVRRARDEHRARSDERAAALLLALQREAGHSRRAPSTKQSAESSASPAAQKPGAPPTRPGALVRKSRLLGESQHPLYLLLRAALSDHTIMANIRIVDLVDAPIGQTELERDPRLRQLLHERADCVVCSNDLVPIAAVVVYHAGIESVPDERIKAEALRELGIRFLRFRADSLPRPEKMRALILG